MPTARELLEQADALMRRNRGLGEPLPPPPAAEEIPELTEVTPAAAVTEPAEPLPRREALARELTEPPHDSYPLPTNPAGITTLDDIPELTDVVEEIEAPSILDASGDYDLGEPSVFMEPGHGEVSILGPWPLPPAAVPPAAANATREGDYASAAASDFDAGVVGVLHVSPELLADDDVDGLPVDVQSEARGTEWVDDGVAADSPPVADGFSPDATEVARVSVIAVAVEAGGGETSATMPGDALETPPLASNAAAFLDPGIAPPEPESPMAVDAQPAAPPLPTAEDAERRWDQITEEIRMQVLQRIDIFTDTGLQEQLAARLQPIVDRASDELVTTINQQVGQLLRAYVAEAIEREIQQWRADHRA